MNLSIVRNLQSVKSELKTEIFGQDHAINKVVDMITLGFSGLNDEQKPIASFLFTGPTGVGKTELAKNLAKKLDMEFIRFDMSEYTSPHSVSNLIGGDAGLVGYEDGGLLTNAIEQSPSSIVLFDEIEKADKKVLNIFLQILDYARLTSTKGYKVDFSQAIIIFTSNLGAMKNEVRTVGFGSKSYIEKLDDVGEHLSPELRARINTHIEFNGLTDDISKLIANKYLNEFSTRLKKQNISVIFDESVSSAIVEITKKERLGTRFIQNMINEKIKITVINTLANNSDSNLKSTTIRCSDINELQFEFHYNSNKSSKNKHTGNSQTNARSMSDEYDFATAEQAHSFAKENIGTWVKRSPYGVGYVVV